MLVKSFLAIASVIACVSGHGRVVDPPARNSVWRYDKTESYPKDYDDDMLNCGGFGTQWDSINNGRCGVCGDEWNNKNPQTIYPGTYYTGRIVKTYKRGQVFTLKLQITANHKGHHTFRVGKIGTPPMTLGKLTHTLQLADGSGTKWPTPPGTKVFDIKLKLPEDLTCDHCVLQWYWRAGNNWGCDNTGCGNGKNEEQETFVNCVDIAITAGGVPPPTKEPPVTQPPTKEPPVTQPPQPPTAPPTEAPKPNPGGCKATGAHAGNYKFLLNETWDQPW